MTASVPAGVLSEPHHQVDDAGDDLELDGVAAALVGQLRLSVVVLQAPVSAVDAGAGGCGQGRSAPAPLDVMDGVGKRPGDGDDAPPFGDLDLGLQGMAPGLAGVEPALPARRALKTPLSRERSRHCFAPD